jgi:hypothetical protein
MAATVDSVLLSRAPCDDHASSSHSSGLDLELRGCGQHHLLVDPLGARLSSFAAGPLMVASRPAGK